MKRLQFNAAAIKRYTSVHTWTGITTGVLLFVAFYAGAITIFKAEIDDWANPRYQYEQEQIASGNTHTPQAVMASFLDSPHAKPDFVLHLGDERERPWVRWDEPQEEEREFYHLYAPDAEPVPFDEQRRSAAAPFIEQLHFTMGLPETFGTYLFGLVTLIYGVALVSGLMIHLPNLVQDLFSIRAGRNLKRFWQDAHNVIGVVSLPFHLMYVVTSLLLTVSIVALLGTNFFTLGNRLPVDDVPQLFDIAPERTASETPAGMLSVPELLAATKTHSEELEPTHIRFSGYGTETAHALIQGHYAGSIVGHASVQLNAATGKLLGADLPGDHQPFLAASAIITSLHYAEFGENVVREAVRVAYFALGLLGAFLFYSGNLLWIETRRKRRSPEQPGHHYAIARLTVAGCLGSALGISVLLLVAKLLPSDYEMRGAAEMWAWYLTLAASVVWVFARPVWRGAVDLLLASAAVTALLPIANALFYMPLWESVGRARGVFAFDLGAVLMAAGFALLARATARRAVLGEPNSVWAHSGVRSSAVTLQNVRAD